MSERCFGISLIQQLTASIKYENILQIFFDKFNWLSFPQFNVRTLLENGVWFKVLSFE